MAIVLTWLLFTIKYYYGPDIWFYVPNYETIPAIGELLAHPDDSQFEIGYALFCSLLRHVGVSFYWMTAIVSTFYFACIYLLFREIKRKQTFALMILVILDFNLIFAAYRQCVSVGCFILTALALRNEKYLKALCWAVLTMLFHKSGAFVVAATLMLYLFFYAIRHFELRSWVYELLLVVLVIVLLLPMANITNSFIHSLPLPSSYIDSIKHHLGLGKQIQAVFALYAILLIVIAHYLKHEKTRQSTIAVFALAGLVFIVALYQYYYLLNRIRSYFIPLAIYFVFTKSQDAETGTQVLPYAKLLKQLACIVTYLYLAHNVYTFTIGASRLHYKIYRPCTVLNLIGHQKEAVQRQQLNIAYGYWTQDFMKDESNKVLHD